jgi:PPOX class probable F420-dependent enzyme
MTTIPEEYLDLFEKKAFCHLATLMPDGSPQVTPVWVTYDGTHVLIDSAKGRVKDRNMRQDNRVALAISDPDDPYRYLQVRGRVVEITEEGADELIDQLAQKYLDVEEYPYRQPDEVRVAYKIAPESVNGMG